MPQALQNVLNTLSNFFTFAKDSYLELLDAINADDSKVLLTFVVAFPLCYLGAWILKKLIRIHDPD